MASVLCTCRIGVVYISSLQNPPATAADFCCTFIQRNF